MKKTITAIILTFSIITLCLFVSCNPAFDKNGSSKETESKTEPEQIDFDNIIKEIQNQINDLKKDQFISDSERNTEIKRLESLIKALQEAQSEMETNKECSDRDTDKETESHTDAEDGSDDGETVTQAETSLMNGTYLYIINDDGSATVTGYNGDEAVITIPKKIDGHTVTAIGDNAFASDSLRSITIPDGVAKIGWFAFKDCPSLRSIVIPKSVISIGYSAFSTSAKNLVLVCEAGSFAVNYAESYGIAYSII